MEIKKCVDVPSLPKGGQYSHAVVAKGLVFVSGQTGQVPGKQTTFDEQFKNAMDKIKSILSVSGSSIDDVVKTNVYISDAKYFQTMNQVYASYFSKEPPARTTLVTNFVASDVLVEVDVIALKR